MSPLSLIDRCLANFCYRNWYAKLKKQRLVTKYRLRSALAVDAVNLYVRKFLADNCNLMTQEKIDMIVHSCMVTASLYATTTAVGRFDLLKKLSAYLMRVMYDDILIKNEAKLQSLKHFKQPAILFFHHTIDDFVAVFVIVHYLSGQGIKVCVLQREVRYSERNSQLSGMENVRFCDVNDPCYLDVLKKSITEGYFIITFPDSLYARHENLNNKINFYNMYGADKIQHSNPILNDILQRDFFIYKDQLCHLSYIFKLNLIPISGYIQPDKFDIIVHSEVNNLASLDESDCDNFMKEVYSEKIDNFLKLMPRWIFLESYLDYYARCISNKLLYLDS